MLGGLLKGKGYGLSAGWVRICFLEIGTSGLRRAAHSQAGNSAFPGSYTTHTQN